MSAVRDSFHASILAKRFSEAVITLNGLNMEEMLPALAAIGEKNRQEVIKALFATLGQVFTSRIQYALEVVRDLQLPSFAPGDLQQTGQVDDAKAFIAIPTVPPRRSSSADATAIDVITAINPTSIAQNREFAGLIFQQGNLFGFTAPARSPDETAATPGFNFPQGTTGIAVYHTHGAGFKRISGSTAAESFSLEDRLTSKNHDVDNYVGTPDGHILKLTKPPASARADLTQLGVVTQLK
jgi:hypothetical protein